MIGLFTAAASSDNYGLFTAVAAIVASFTGVGVWWATRKANRAEAKSDAVRRDADFTRAEVESWKTLIETTRAQYMEVSNEAAELRGRLAERDKNIDRMGTALRTSADQLAVQSERIRVLSEAVTTLGGSIDEINRHGKKGDQGDKGIIGDQGQRGDQGDKGDKGPTGSPGSEYSQSP